MPEIKNTFIKSKMNKDLDDRLLSNGEYRDAVNVNISRSEGDDVGALENVLGNKDLGGLPTSAVNLEVIGYLKDDESNRAFFIVTNYVDSTSDQLSGVAPYDSLHYIVMRDFNTNTTSKLVEGYFLNFSKTHPVYGIDLIENLLFWTDNRNQPRKINIDNAISSLTYYNKEEQISVAKYYPHDPIKVYRNVSIANCSGTATTYTTTTVLTRDNIRAGMNIAGTDIYVLTAKYTSPYQFNTTSTLGTFGGQTIQFIQKSSQNSSDEFLRPSMFGFNFGSVIYISSTKVRLIGLTALPRTDMQFNAPGFTDPDSLPTVTSASFVAGVGVNTYDIQLNGAHGIPNNLPSLYVVSANLAWPNPDYISTFPGDSDLLKDKFVRFAYRFKFEDGEYSLISPFTQPIFIPFQNGYISDTIKETPGGSKINDGVTGEEPIYSTTIVPFFENSVDSVDLYIDAPYVWRNIREDLKIIEVDILYKESDGLAISLLETIDSGVFSKNQDGSSNISNTLIYRYQSRKPFRTLPPGDVTRVFDKVPVRSQSQSSVGNRIIYGNFIDKHTPPENLDYNVRIDEKVVSVDPTATNAGLIYNNACVAYPTHTVKQNRSYQIGIVLSDKYGRQSDVILSSITDFQQSQDSGTTVFDGSTVFHPYKSNTATNNPATWKGDSIKVLFRNAIPSSVSYASGYPGLYRSGDDIVPRVTANTSPTTGVYTLDSVIGISIGDVIDLPTAGDPITSVISAIDTSNKQITISDLDIGTPATAPYNVTIHTTENKLGWYSYKVVVKQQAEDYYNAYLGNVSIIPSASAIRSNDGGSTNSKAYPFAGSSYVTSLVSDNVNKIPADLNTVGPEQTQFGTSDTELYPRVGGTTEVMPGTTDGIYSQQFFFNTSVASINGYGKLTDIGIAELKADGTQEIPVQAEGVFAAASNPPSIILSMPKGEVIGKVQTKLPSLSVFEVKPRESLLELYWETSTCGLISDLNEAIAAGANASSVTPSPPLTPQDPAG
jgi:hypothetical protein